MKKRIIKHHDCPIIPQRSKDAIVILYEVGAVGDETFSALNSAIGFRNSMIHDYMKFNVNILYSVLQKKSYLDIYDFLIEDINYKEVIIKRIENYTL